jgi:hypothetical protein
MDLKLGLTLRVQHRLGVWENRKPKKMFGSRGMRQQMSGEDYVATSSMLCSPYQISFQRSNKSLRWAGHVARMENKRVAHRVFVGRPNGKRPL